MTSTTSIWATQERSNSSGWGQGLTALASSARAVEGQRRRPSSLINQPPAGEAGPDPSVPSGFSILTGQTNYTQGTGLRPPAGPRASRTFPEPLAETHWENSAPGPCAPSATWLVHIFTTPKAKKIGNNNYRERIICSDCNPSPHKWNQIIRNGTRSRRNYSSGGATQTNTDYRHVTLSRDLQGNTPNGAEPGLPSRAPLGGCTFRLDDYRGYRCSITANTKVRSVATAARRYSLRSGSGRRHEAFPQDENDS
jgi:hypothetical protein